MDIYGSSLIQLTFNSQENHACLHGRLNILRVYTGEIKKLVQYKLSINMDSRNNEILIIIYKMMQTHMIKLLCNMKYIA